MPLAKTVPGLLAPAPVASLQGPAVDVGGYPTLDLVLRVSSLSGSTARARVETSEDQVWWDALGDPLELTAVGKATATLAPAQRWVRLVLEADGGMMTGAALAKAFQVFAVPADLYRCGINQEALSKISLGEKYKALADATDVALSYIRRTTGVSLPLASWGGELRTAVTKIAAYDLRSAEGYQPTKEEQDTLRQRYKDAIAWLEQLVAGEVVIDDGNEGNGPPGPTMPEVYSDPPWGFPCR